MLRIGLSTYLSVVTLAGPWFCCCTTTRLLARLAPSAPTDAQPRAQCCCHAHSASTVAPCQTRPGAPAQAPPRHNCPCGQNARDTLALPSARSPGSEIETLSRLLALVPSVGGLVMDTWNSLDPADLSGPLDIGSPFLTASDLLRAHHLLRC